VTLNRDPGIHEQNQAQLALTDHVSHSGKLSHAQRAAALNYYQAIRHRISGIASRLQWRRRPSDWLSHQSS